MEMNLRTHSPIVNSVFKKSSEAKNIRHGCNFSKSSCQAMNMRLRRVAKRRTSAMAATSKSSEAKNIRHGCNFSKSSCQDDDAYWIERKKAQIKAKLRAEMPMEPNNEDDSDE
nr:hypothetical protein [Tanacetum cinerariifolium]